MDDHRRLRKGKFVAQVVARSMEPAIAYRAWWLFRAHLEGTQEGKIALVQRCDTADPEIRQCYFFSN